jgi:hypothetical protein
VSCDESFAVEALGTQVTFPWLNSAASIMLFQLMSFQCVCITEWFTTADMTNKIISVDFNVTFEVHKMLKLQVARGALSKLYSSILVNLKIMFL